MHRILIMGAGKIGSLISFLLAHSNDYHVFLADTQMDNPHVRRLGEIPNFQYVQINAENKNDIIDFIKKHQIESIVSSLPYYFNSHVAHAAAEAKTHYFDLTEDVKTTELVREISKSASTAFVPQCGLAPGFISIIANHLMKNFPKLDTVKLRVGALPINISNALQYSLTWSTDGLINEYGNLCQALENGKAVTVLPLEGLEEIKIDGLTYEAFNTSGGVGSLVESYANKVKHLSYKTIRYPGHCAKMKFLMNDLKLNQDREMLKHIFEHAIPKTYQDVVLVYVSVNGLQNDEFVEENYVRKFYPKRIMGHAWSAIQLTTASEISAIIDIVCNHPNKYHGFIRQEDFSFPELVGNRFGEYYS